MGGVCARKKTTETAHPRRFSGARDQMYVKIEQMGSNLGYLVLIESVWERP